MAKKATEILWLASAREQLGLDTDPPDTSQDRNIEQAINAAIAKIQRATGLPLLDVDEEHWVVPVSNDQPLLMPVRHVKTPVRHIKYWTPTQARREDPDGSVSTDQVGRVSEVLRVPQWCTEIWPPAAGWPDRLVEMPFLVGVTRSYTLQETDQDVVTLAILLMREYYEQPDREEFGPAVTQSLEALLQTNG